MFFERDIECPVVEKREESEDRAYFKGQLVSFGEIDDYATIFDKGVFQRSISAQNGKVPLLADHDWRAESQIGSNDVSENTVGLQVTKGTINLNKSRGQSVFENIQFYRAEGMPMGMSVGFRAEKWMIDKDDIFHFTRAILKEGSIVLFPASEGGKIRQEISEEFTEKTKELDLENTNKVYESMSHRLQEYESDDVSRRCLTRGLAEANYIASARLASRGDTTHEEAELELLIKHGLEG